MSTLAERAGFEPAVACTTPVFKDGPAAVERAAYRSLCALEALPDDRRRFPFDVSFDVRARGLAMTMRGAHPETLDRHEYERRVVQMAVALHEECRLEWQAIGVADPGRMVTQHMVDTHYGLAHNLVRRIFGEANLDASRQMLRETLAALTDVFPLIPEGDDWRDAVRSTMNAARAVLANG